MARLLLVSGLLLSGLLAGCFGDDGPAELPPVLEPLTFYEVPETVVVFNATQAGVVEFVFSMKPACTVPDPAEVLSLYDRDGLVTRVAYAAEPGVADVVVPIPVNGTAPFALAGQLIPCADAASARVTGITDGFQPRALQFSIEDDGGKTYNWVADAVATAAVAAGGDVAEVPWAPDEFTWGLYNIRSTEEGRSGVGVTRQIVYDAAGRAQYNVGCAMLVLEPCLDQQGPFLFTPEGYRFIVESDAPSPMGVARSVVFSHHRFTMDACALGFAWALCA